MEYIQSNLVWHKGIYVGHPKGIENMTVVIICKSCLLIIALWLGTLKLS